VETEALKAILLSLTASGLWEVIRMSWESAWGGPDENAIDEAVNAAVAELEDLDSLAGGLESERVSEFLRSPEARKVVRQIFATDGKSREEVAREFHQLWRVRAGDDAAADPAGLDRLFGALVSLCDRSLEKAVEAGSLTALGARQVRHHAEISGSLSSIEQTLRVLADAPELDAREVDEYAAEYRRMLRLHTRTITPPALDAARRVPADSIYVPAYLEEIDAMSPLLPYKGFAETFFHSVVLGDPGAGKTTLVKKIAADLAADTLSLDGRPPGQVPIIVSLRAFGLAKRAEQCSIVEFIETTSNSDYQLPPPLGAIEYLLLTDRAVVVFDGLDELLDTHHRAEVCADVENFAALYPSSPILVTCREEAFGRTPLSGDVFDVFRLTPFSDAEAHEYARRWFAIEQPDGDAWQRADELIADTAGVAELRSNAFMLALMCGLYRGGHAMRNLESGRIPRNRAEIYEACAKMLVNRWDQMRGIGEPSPMENLRLPTLQHLAAWIYADESLQGGVTERQLVKEAREFLRGRRVADPEESAAEAERFVEHYCKRAEVFADVGVNASGEAQFQLTHRTFIEFFTARDLVSENPSTEGILETLLPRISAGEWSLVGEIALQLFAREATPSDLDALLSGLAWDDVGLSPDARANRVYFAVRGLVFLTPSSAVVTAIAEAALDGLMLFCATQADAQDFEPSRDIRTRTVRALLEAHMSNVAAITDVLVERISSWLSDRKVASFAAELGLNLKLHGGTATAEAEPGPADEITERVIGAHRERLEEIGLADKWIGSDLVMAGALDPGLYVSAHGLPPFFQSRPYRLFPGSLRNPLAEIVVGSLLWHSHAEMPVQSALGCLTSLAPHLHPNAFTSLNTFSVTGKLLLSWRGGSRPARDLGVDELSADQRYAFLVLVGMLLEESIDSGLRLGNLGLAWPDSGLAPLWDAVPPVLLGRSPNEEGRDKAIAAIEELGLPEGQQQALLDWVDGSVSFRSARGPGQSRESSSISSAS
jgi:GTPase SAR1 family protein